MGFSWRFQVLPLVHFMILIFACLTVYILSYAHFKKIFPILRNSSIFLVLFYQVFFRVGCKVGAYDGLWYASFSKIFQQSFVLDKTKKSL